MKTEGVQPKKTYWSREMAALLQIGDSTLRKWSLALEAAGYAFVCQVR